MWSTASVLVCALSLLGRNASTLPPIEFVETRPPDASKTAEAFTRSGSDVIYIVMSSTVFQRAQQTLDYAALAKIASIIVHEEWHLRYGSDESGAYDAQLLTLTRLGRGPGTSLYDEVRRSKLAVLARLLTPSVLRH